MKSQAEQKWESLRKEWSAGAFDHSHRVGVLAAHPDDETIGASALLARCASPVVIFLTDGAPGDSRLWPPHFRGSRQDYATCRRREAEAALANAGVSANQIFWLGGIDQEAVLDIPRFSVRLLNVISSLKLDLLITHPYEGGHPDHDAAALIASLAVSQFARKILHLEMTSYHVREGRCETGVFLNEDPDTEFVFELSDKDRERKKQMLSAYASQKLVLDNFPVDYERLRLAPPYDFAAPPHEGRLWYEILGWSMTGARWRELVAAALHSEPEIHAADCA